LGHKPIKIAGTPLAEGTVMSIASKVHQDQKVAEPVSAEARRREELARADGKREEAKPHDAGGDAYDLACTD
jgi:hypothetical protein